MNQKDFWQFTYCKACKKYKYCKWLGDGFGWLCASCRRFIKKEKQE